MELWDKIQEAVNALKPALRRPPALGVILGTGLGKLAEKIVKDAEISYEKIPHFAVSTAESHTGKLILGTIAGKAVVAMQGRFHCYEGYSMEQITFPVRVMKALGVQRLIVSNACGGLNPNFRKGDIMLISDHINLLGDNPLIGRHDDRFGPRFPDMSRPYDKTLTDLALGAARDLGLALRTGVYASLSGPSLETAAEYRFLRTIGADGVGMSTVPEVIVAVQCGLRVLGLSVITDLCQPDDLKPVDVKEIIAVAEAAEPRLVALLERVIEKL